MYPGLSADKGTSLQRYVRYFAHIASKLTYRLRFTPDGSHSKHPHPAERLPKAECEQCRPIHN